MTEDLHKKTKKLIADLNYFLAHIILFFIANIAGVFYAFSDIQKYWWIFLLTAFWAIGLIYHSIRVYGVDLLKSKYRKVKLLFQWLMKLSFS